MSTTRLLNVLAKLDKLLSKYRIGYIVVGSLADYLLGTFTVRPGDIDILVSRENTEKLNTAIQQEQGGTLLEPIRWRRKGTIRGLHGRALLDRMVIDIMADLQLKYLDRWVLFSHRNLLPYTMEVSLTDTLTVRIPCPEIQVIANKALGRLDRARVIKDVMEKKRCNVRVDECILVTSH